MSGRATGDDSGLIDLDSIMKGAASEPAPSAPALVREASAPASTPQPRPRADDSLAVAAVTTDRPPPSVASVPSPRPSPERPSAPPPRGVEPIMKPIPATAERSASGRSTLRTAVVVVAAGLLLAGGTIGVARMRATHAPSVAAAPPHDPPRDKRGEPSSQPPSNAQAPALENASGPNEPATPVGALGQVSSAGTSARARVAPSANAHAPSPAATANAELHTSDLPTSPGGGSLDLGGAMKSAVKATDDVAATTGDPSGAAKARTVRPSPGASSSTPAAPPGR